MQATVNKMATNVISQNNYIVNAIPQIIGGHVLYLFPEMKENSTIKKIYDALKELLNGHYDKYNFDEDALEKLLDKKLSEEQFQQILANLNEKEDRQKTAGVYYTPRDAVNYIVCNAIGAYLIEKDGKLYDTTEMILKDNKNANKLFDFLFCDTIMDPTCGSGEFLMSALKAKTDILNYSATSKISDAQYLEILNTIKGNDINIESIEICKIRLFFATIKHLKSDELYMKVALTLNRNLYNYDFVNVNKNQFQKHHIIIGNPPYVEDSKSEIVPLTKYGNIYANILQNSLNHLTANGVMAFIIPISYISTPRMATIRRYVESNTTYQYLLNYADRPDCLFNSVHQKLSILIAKQGNSEHKLFTANYRYWYKKERNELFSKTEMIKTPILSPDFYAKLGNKITRDIFKKVYTNRPSDSILGKCIQGQFKEIFLNLRACFWIKAFSFNPGSKEFKSFKYDDMHADFVICVLNSSLFFLFWISISDCWHITQKDIKHFKIPNSIDNTAIFKQLAANLEKRLEETKQYIGSKQTEYEYKHKDCKVEIDKIDDELKEIYGLTNEELLYVKSYATKYRQSLGG